MSNRSTVDALAEDFVDPAPEYGPVPLWWWDGEELDHERLTQQLEDLAGNGVPGVCFISKLPNGPAGNTPQYFTEDWWAAMEHVVSECERLGMELWVHDETYHHSPPTWREFWQDHLRTEAGSNPDLRGEVLHREHADVGSDEAVTLSPPRDFTPLVAAAYPRDADGRLDLDDAAELDRDGGEYVWDGREGDWHVTVVGKRPEGLCYTDGTAVERYIDLHFEEYVRRLGDAVGETLVGTFEDELVILDDEVPCDDAVIERFRDENGYDPVDRLVALYEDTDATVEIRTDYYDVVVDMLETHWFEPLFEWHDEHGLVRAHDNWGRNDLANGTEQYGDYYSTMRWYQVPGYDDGGAGAIGDRNFFDAKLSASIAACYDRDRVWGELFHSTTWGFRPRTQLAGLVENVCYGCTLYDKHGCYYTTNGGWWAHAPPDTHFRQPYWDDIGDLNSAAHRLSRAMSAGTPVVDAAVAVPSATMHADWHPEDGVGDVARSVDEATREISAALYDAGTDLVLADDDSLAAAEIDGSIGIEGMDIPALVLPPATAVPAETLAAARDLYESGGVVVSVGDPPETVVGDADAVATEQFDEWDGTQTVRENDAGGVLAVLPADGDVPGVVAAHVEPDLRRDAPDVYHAHRSLPDGDVYLVFNVRDEARSVTVGFRAGGVPERWDSLTGEREPIREYQRVDGYTTTTFEFAPHGFALVALREDGERRPRIVDGSDALDVTEVTEREVSGFATADGETDVTVAIDGEERVATGETGGPRVSDLTDGWTFALSPALDNEWGDFRYPASDETLGAEVREFDYRYERPGEDGADQGWWRPGFDADGWESVRWSYGPGFWRKTDVTDGPGATPEEDPTGWEPYEFSQDVGKPGTHAYLMGYMSTVSDDFLVSPDGDGRTFFWTTISTDEPGTYLCHYGAEVDALAVGGREVAAVAATDEPIDVDHEYEWLNQPSDAVEDDTVSVRLPAGETPVLVGVEPGSQTYFAVEPEPGTAFERELQYVPRVRWFHEAGQGPADFDHRPWDEDPVGWYRFEVPAGASSFDLPITGEAAVWVDGERVEREGRHVRLDEVAPEPTPVAVRVDHRRGAYGGGAWEAPVRVETAPITVETGDWRDLGFDSYSGRATYRRTVECSDVDDRRVLLEIEDLAAAATVRVDGDEVGSTFAPPFTVDLTDHVDGGDHEIEIDVANTLSNHFASETPNDYRELLLGSFFREDADLLPEYDESKQYAGGLLGSVRLREEPAVTLPLE